MGQGRDGDAGLEMSISPSIQGWGCSRGTQDPSAPSQCLCCEFYQKHGAKIVQRKILVLPKRKLEVKIGKKKRIISSMKPSPELPA